MALATRHVVETIIVIVMTVTLLLLLALFLKKSKPEPVPLVYSDYAMVMVEPRPHKLMGPVLHNFHTYMDKKWDLYVFHGKSHAEYAKEAVGDISKSRGVYLLPLETDNLTASGYNFLFKQPSFWDRVRAENILVIQTDTSICGNSAQSIDNFTHLNYIGCAYNKHVHGMHRTPWGKNNCFGVGGLSFRKKSFMLACIETLSEAARLNGGEDVIFSNCAANMGGMPESGLQMSEFCTQHSFDAKSWGVHKPSISNKQAAQDFLEYCPEAIPLYQGKPPLKKRPRKS
jgi:hypothetical protein